MKDEGRNERNREIPQRVRKRAQHVFPLSYSFRITEYSRSNANVTIHRYYTLFLGVTERLRSKRRKDIDLFHSSIIPFYFSRRFRSRLPFDLSLSRHVDDDLFLFTIQPTTDDIHRLFYCSLPPNILLSFSWSFQLFAILFLLVEIIAGTFRWWSVYAK